MGKQWKQCQTFFWGAPKSLQMVIAARAVCGTCGCFQKMHGGVIAPSFGAFPHRVAFKVVCVKIYMQVKNQKLELDMEQQTGSK